MASEDSTATPSSTKSKIPYSHSSPTAIDGASNGGDSSEAKLRAGKLLAVNVCMLDESCVTMHVQPKALGRVLFELVCKHLNLLEVDYFGLEYGESNDNKYWLDCDKPMNKQLDLNLTNCKMNFGVKFYTPDPSQLEEEYTRYLFCLQIKKDLSTGWLQCNDNTAALMASYIVQADCGDFVAEDYPDHTYLSTYKFFPHQDEELEKKIMENHKKHVGQTPATADLNLLETARRCELYGIRMHPAKDQAGVSLNLAIAHMGVLVFQNYTKINTFSWAKIRKLSFKRKRFLIKLHPEGYGFIKDLVEFLFEGRNECKNFWKKCVEHHGFFRCSSVKKTPRQKARVLSRGSSFRYSGRTQKQVVDYVRDNYVKRQPFQRSQSFRHSSSAHSSIGKVGSSKSAQPLLPVGDQTVGTPASQSCGSMVLNDSASTEAPASPCSDRISGVIRTSPELHSDWQRQTSPEGTRVTTHQNEEPSVVNGGITTKSVEAEPLRKEGETTGLSNSEVRTRASTQSGTESPSSRSSLPQDDSARERNEADGEDNVSQDSYQLSEHDIQGSRQASLTRVAKAEPVLRSGAMNGEVGPSCNGRGVESPTGSAKCDEDGKQGTGMNGTEQRKSDSVANEIDGDIPYVLHKRRLDSNNGEPSGTVFGAEIPPPLPSLLTHPGISGMDGQASKTTTKPNKPPRVQVEVEHPKITQSSPTLYARNRVNRESPPRTSPVPKSPSYRPMDYVFVHDLPAARSYSSKDDSLCSPPPIEKVIEEQLQKRKTESCSSMTSVDSSVLSHDSDYLEPLCIIESGDEDVIPPIFKRRGPVPPPKRPPPQPPRVTTELDDLDFEWDKLAPTFPPPPPPPPPPRLFGDDEEDDDGDIGGPTPTVTSPGTRRLQEARKRFLRSTIHSAEGARLRPGLEVEELSDASVEDTDPNYIVEEFSDRGEDTGFGKRLPPTSLSITEQELQGGGEMEAERLDGDSITTFKVEAYETRRARGPPMSKSLDVEIISLPCDGDGDDEETDPCRSVEETLLFPVRTLSRISEHSASEISESKDSTPSQASRPSDERRPSVGELPSDYSTSDDNPSEGAGGGVSSNESEGSPARGRLPGTGSGLGLSPIRGFRTTAIVENRYVLPDDGDNCQMETYYMEIDSVQKERLEKEGVFERLEYDPIPADTLDDTSSTDNTLQEEGSPVERVKVVMEHMIGRSAPLVAGGLSPSYEGFDVKINVVPSNSPSPVQTPELLRSPVRIPGSPGCIARLRHRAAIELQVANGHILENRHASLNSPGADSDSGTIANPYAEAFH